MKRLHDYLFGSEGFPYIGTPMVAPFGPELPDGIFVVDNVAEYVMETVGLMAPEFNYRAPDYPCTTPPYEKTWVEYTIPKHFRVEGAQQTSWGTNWLIGVAFTTLDLNKQHGTPKVVPILSKLENLKKRAIDYIDQAKEQQFVQSVLDGDPRWYVYAKIYAVDTYRSTVFFSGNVESSLVLSNEGLLLAPPLVSVGSTHIFEESGYDKQDVLNIQRFLLAPAMYSLAMTHIRNVQQVDHDPPLLDRAARRRGERRGLSYKTLTIKPVGAKARALAVQQGNKDVLLRWHLVRGHRADYRENGLFGKYHGIYWVPGHARGDKNQGQVLKDYEVVTGRDRRQNRSLVRSRGYL